NESQDETQWEVIPHSQHLACNSCGRSFEHLTPHHFSFNSNLGWCSSCEGIGIQTGANLSLMIPDTRLTLAEGVLKLWPDLENRISRAMLEALGARLGVPTDLPFEKLTPRQRRIMLHGGPPQWIEVQIPADGSDPARKFSFQFKGLYPALAEASRLSASLRSRLEHLIDEVECSTCGGSRIRDDAGAYRFRNETVETLCRTPLGDLLSLVNKWELDDREQLIAGELLREIKARLEFLNEIGLFYLSLNRPSAT
ncbi:MAG TPA: excinuclease ABC subunit A, partial [Planctomycetaceae bacterium]|nr:excinuclease ABC subunit A [Planctomycetaceae bacterium]